MPRFAGGDQAKPFSKRTISLAGLLPAIIAVTCLIGAQPAAASWTNEPFSSITAFGSSSGSGATGDFYGTAVDGTSTIAVGDDYTTGYGQISTAGGSHQWNFQENFNNTSSVNLKDPSMADYSLNSVSCPTVSFCVAVGGEGIALTFNGSTWSTFSKIDSPNTLTSVSCTSSTFCMAVDGAGNALVSTNGGTSWTKSNIDSTNTLIGVSCASANYCLALDATDGFAYNSGTWTSGYPIDSAYHDLTSVSCVTSTPFCMAVDGGGYTFYCSGSAPNCSTPVMSYAVGYSLTSNALNSVSCASASYCVVADNAGNVYVYNGSTFSSATNIDSTTILDSISCPTATFCIAVDARGNALECTSGTSCSTAGNWTSTSIDGSNNLTGISCVSPSYCWAIDNSGNAILFNTYPWTVSTGIDGNNPFVAVSCVSATWCMAVDNRSPAGSYIYNGATWSSHSALPNANSITSLSCASTSFCMAGDNANNFFIYNGTSWTNEVNGGDGVALGSMSCPSSSFCMAGDANGVVYEYTGGSGWYYINFGGPCGPSLTCASTGTPYALTSISCTSSTFCELTDNAGDIYTDSSNTWTAAGISGNGFNSVSCITSSAFCSAVDSGGYTYLCTSSSNCSTDTWAAGTDIDGTTSISSVSCTSSTFCMAVDAAGNALAYNGTSWNANPPNSWTNPVVGTGTTSLNSVSCYSSNFCASVDSTGDGLVYIPVSWGSPGAIVAVPVIESTSCTSSTFCMSVDESGDAYAYNGSDWTTLTTWANPIDSGNTLTGVSCVSTSFCVAVDSNGNGIVYGGGSSWTKTAVHSGFLFSGVSCESSSLCVVVESDTVGSTQSYEYYTGTWTGNVSTGDTNVLTGISCLSGTPYCMAIDQGGNAVVCSGTGTAKCNGGTAWATFATGDANQLKSVSCISTTDCMVVDVAGNALFTANGGSSWSTTSVESVTALESVSCVSATFCAAVDGNGNAYTWNGASWSAASDNPVDPYLLTSVSCVTSGPPSNEFCGAGDNEGNTLTTYDVLTGPLYSVACPVPGQCVAVGVSTTPLSPMILRSTSPTNSGSWLSVPVPAGTGELFGLACPTSSICYAVGTGAGNVGAVLLSSTNGGSSWSSDSIPTNLGSADVTGLYGVSCIPGSPSDCYAVGKGTSGGATYGVLVYTDNGGSGTCASTPASWTSSVGWCVAGFTSSTGEIGGIACTSTPVCITSGNSTGGTNQSTVYVNTTPTSSPSSFGTVTEPTQTGVSYLYGVACRSTSWCYSYGWTSGAGTIWENSSAGSFSTWTAVESSTSLPAGTPGGAPPYAWFSMACAASTCTAVGTNQISTSDYYAMGAYGS